MWVLSIGLLIFFGIHLLPTFAGARQRLIKWKGEGFYKIIFSIAALTGLMLIIHGKAVAPVIAVYHPPAWTTPVNWMLMWLALVIFPAAYLPSNLRRFMRHPFLWGVTLWAVAHLLVNGDLASLLLFASFAVFSLFDMWSSNRRGATFSKKRLPLRWDGLLILVGTSAYVGLIFLHPLLFGVTVQPS